MARTWRPLTCLLGILAALLSTNVRAQAPPEKKNWFDDPFFQLSSGLTACPVPLGPMLTEEEQRQQAHGRIERGTRCFRAGQCQDFNAYRYDKTLAVPVQAALQAVPGVASSSVWVTIQRRWVFLEGCVSQPALIPRLVQAAQAVPDVEAVVPLLMTGTRAKPRYAVQAP
ncbi:BON domain-containing protein [Polaromonas sp. SM01]|uniref:BON domain-containing protein n=1 Tax=Polaromonas sp. SM01 TaxID=3085630 RepID=UPI002981248D|nr:BON domain-containing protein [Polaromonas sp. SM01]MDW5441349.1 BON domain-containing protein [Polaromonas sp. SM01]